MGAAVRTLFFGSGSVALPALERLHRSDVTEIVAVVTAPPRPAGRKHELRPTLAAATATDLALPVLTPRSLRDPQALVDLRALAPELVVLADYGRIIPAAVLDLPRHGALNIHPSLLPRHRGAAPVPAAIMEGDGVTGVTVMRMDEGLDTGPILAQQERLLDGSEVAPELESELAVKGADLLMGCLPGWLDGSLQARPQPEEGATLTRPLRRSDGYLDHDRTAIELERQVRAFQPWPGAFLETDSGRLKVLSASLSGATAEPGELVADGDTVALGTADGSVRLDEVQPAGKRRMSGAEWQRGRRA